MKFFVCLAILAVSTFAPSNSYHCTDRQDCADCPEKQVHCTLSGAYAGPTTCETSFDGIEIKCEVKNSDGVVVAETSHTCNCDSSNPGQSRRRGVL